MKYAFFSLYVVLNVNRTGDNSNIERRKALVDQAKIGSFLKELRKEKKLTQEQIAEQFGVASRTVSRWENAKN